MKGAYDSFVSQSTKMGSLYSNLATETMKPFEGLLSKARLKPGSFQASFHETPGLVAGRFALGQACTEGWAGSLVVIAKA